MRKRDINGGKKEWMEEERKRDKSLKESISEWAL